MSLLAVIASLSMAATPQAGPYHCPAMGSEITKPAEVVEYKGVEYYSCCAGCADQFAKDPDAMIKADAKKGLLIGKALFDPVTGVRIKPKDDAPYSDYKGIRYFFTSADEKTTFDATPKKFAKAPAKEVLKCPVTGEAVASMAAAAGYVDNGGVRYYLCCPDCVKPMTDKPADHVASVKDNVADATVHKVDAPADEKKG